MSARAGARRMLGQATIEAGQVGARTTVGAPVAGPRLPQLKRHSKEHSRFDLIHHIGRALDRRRLFLLLPFAMIAGLIIYAALPVEPEIWALAGVAAILSVALVLPNASIGRTRALTLLGALWVGISLLPLHGLLFGTNMLGFPVYGQFTATVDEILSASPTRATDYRFPPGANRCTPPAIHPASAVVFAAAAAIVTG